MLKPGTPRTLTGREQSEIDSVYQRTRVSDHFQVLGVMPGDTGEAIHTEYLRLRSWIDSLQTTERTLGEYKPRIDAISSAVETAYKVVGNPRHSVRIDAGLPLEEQLTDPNDDDVVPVHEGDETTIWRVHGDKSVLHLLAMLDIHLSAALGRPVQLRAMVGMPFDLRDDRRFVQKAQECEQSAQWADAALWWHLAALARPTDPDRVLRAASALRRAGAHSLFKHYARVAYDDVLFAMRDDARE